MCVDPIRCVSGGGEGEGKGNAVVCIVVKSPGAIMGWGSLELDTCGMGSQQHRNGHEKANACVGMLRSSAYLHKFGSG